MIENLPHHGEGGLPQGIEHDRQGFFDYQRRVDSPISLCKIIVTVFTEIALFLPHLTVFDDPFGLTTFA